MGDKDIVCRDFANSGHCRFEGNCKFKHPSKSNGGSDSKSDTICKDYARGHCEYGARCRFKHPVACKDYLQGKCTYMNCKFFHPSGAASNGGPPPGPPRSMKRPQDYDQIPDDICRDYLEAGVCRRPRCSFLHEMPPKRRSMGGPSGYAGPPGPQGPPGVWNDGPVGGGGGGPTIVTPEMKAYVSQLELKLTHYEDKIRDLEKRCEQYEDFNKLLTERNEELKLKLGLGGGGGGGGGSGGYQGGNDYGRSARGGGGGYY
ncbi:hypothetical protein WDU94_010426 [Cyamophila willieti]